MLNRTPLDRLTHKYHNNITQAVEIMETRRPNQPPIESTLTTSLEEAQRHSTQELQESAPKPRGFEGRRHTPEARAKLSEAMKGDKNPNYGKKHTPETKAKMSEANKGEKHPNYGKKLSPEHRAKLSEAQKGEKHPNYGKKRTPETKAKISEAKKGERHHYYGKKLSPEHRAKLSEAKKGEKSYQYDQSIDQVRLAIIDCVLGESQKQASHNQGFADSWLQVWKHSHRQRFDALYLETATELDRMVTSGKIGHLALELAAGATRQELARKLARHLLVFSELPLQPDPQD